MNNLCLSNELKKTSEPFELSNGRISQFQRKKVKELFFKK